ncbi:class I SAM-dependent methyltransferase [Nocardioides caldifontis]|uniref:class I SAM-dependent methyltransferase n=1 Tax=Nocardioides caldifontis TaxID=2588938 RepID=UPI0011DF58AA|nr:class I SAM-dependent methyltransferase [Nocardioides caldifontis]
MTDSLSVRCSDAGLEVRGHDDARLDLHFDGRYLWSFLPSRDGRPLDGGGYLVPWPKVIRPQLHGVVDVVVSGPDTEERVDLGEVTLGRGGGRIDLRDEEGIPLTVDKGGRLERSFAALGPEEKQILLEGARRTIEVLADRGLPAFLAFGCLLGAVREGKLIGHDNDADVSYLSAHHHPFDVILESLRLERHFQTLGWRTRRMWAAYFKAYPPRDDGIEPAIDVFAAFIHAGQLYVLPTVRAPLPESAIVPLTTVTTEGVTLPAPADAPALLEATYGPGWRVPDPTFKFKPPAITKRTLGGWMRGTRRNQRYWDDTFTLRADSAPREPAAFARWVAEREPAGALLEVGCGSGRDAVHLAAQGFRVLATDYSVPGLRLGRERAQQAGVEDIRFEPLNLYDLRHVLVKGALAARTNAPTTVYARNVVDAVSRPARRNLVRLARTVLQGSGGRLYLEYHTERPRPGLGGTFWEHAPPEELVADLEAAGFVVEHLDEGLGLEEEPRDRARACRLVAALSEP